MRWIALFVLVPLAELTLLVAIDRRVGIGWTLALVLTTGVIGANLVRRQGRQVWASFRLRLDRGEIPDTELAHGAMLLVAGALLITPGVLTDAVGFALLVPWVREFVRLRFLRRWRVVRM